MPYFCLTYYLRSFKLEQEVMIGAKAIVNVTVTVCKKRFIIKIQISTSLPFRAVLMKVVLNCFVDACGMSYKRPNILSNSTAY